MKRQGTTLQGVQKTHLASFVSGHGFSRAAPILKQSAFRP